MNDPCRYGLFSGTEETVAVPGHLLTFRILFSGDCFFYGTLFTWYYTPGVTGAAHAVTLFYRPCNYRGWFLWKYAEKTLFFVGPRSIPPALGEYWCFQFRVIRYSSGAAPVIFRNSLLKCCTSGNPSFSAIRLTSFSFDSNIFPAVSTCFNWKYSCIFFPVSNFKRSLKYCGERCRSREQYSAEGESRPSGFPVRIYSSSSRSVCSSICLFLSLRVMNCRS